MSDTKLSASPEAVFGASLDPAMENAADYLGQQLADRDHSPIGFAVVAVFGPMPGAEQGFGVMRLGSFDEKAPREHAELATACAAVCLDLAESLAGRAPE